MMPDEKLKKNLKILIGVYEPLQYDGRAQRLAEIMSVYGEVICFTNNYDGEHDDKTREYQVFSIKTIRKKGLFSYVSYNMKFLFFVIKQDADIVISCNFFLILSGFLSKFVFRKIWIYDAYELLVKSNFKDYSLRDLFFYCTEKKLIKFSNLVVSANEERYRILKSINKLSKSTFILNIPNNKQVIGKEYLEGEFYIVYQGYISVERKLDFYIELLSYLPDFVKLFIIGDGPDMNNVIKCVDSFNVANRVKYFGRLNQNDLLKVTKECHLGIVSYNFSELNTIYCSPNKIFEYTQMGLPVITTSQIFLASKVNKYCIGEIVSFEMNKEICIEKIRRIISNYKFYVRGLESFNSKYSFLKEKNRFLQYSNSVVYQS